MSGIVRQLVLLGVALLSTLVYLVISKMKVRCLEERAGVVEGLLCVLLLLLLSLVVPLRQARLRCATLVAHTLPRSG